MAEQEYKGLHFKPDSINPQGKPKVFFCCHEVDYPIFFEPIMEEIRAIQPNVTFWYYDPAEGIPSGEEFLADLSQMNLFVVPVTYRFIYQDTPARTVEFQYAIDHHIPVLPLMQEPDLEEEFNRVCGDLQLLDKYASQKDPTALPYKEKLKKYLQSVLISDELAQQIRDVFDAYVFLSYRKKDRKYAQEIMNLIHDNEYCRDVAIWYDEFLTPGENFNESIQKVLAKSALFALVVTPNLLEEENYVAKHEYPEATKTDKTIAPIQAKETDLNELETMYPGIKPCLSEEDVKNHFHELFHNVALRENYNDPKHEFFMGLAYLTGIDVEVNHVRALELITAAAEANLPEAYEKLVSMYQNGEGVERNYYNAVDWQEKYIDYLERIVAENPKSIDGKRILCRNYYLLGNLCQLFVEDVRGTIEKHVLSTVYKPRKWYEKAFVCAEQLVNEAGALEDRRNLINLHLQKGQTLINDRHFSEARGVINAAIKLVAGITEEFGALESQNDRLFCYYSMAQLCEAEGGMNEATELYQKIVSMSEVLLNESPLSEVKEIIANSYTSLGVLGLRNKSFVDSVTGFEKANGVFQELIDESGQANYKESVAKNKWYLGDVYKEEKRVLDAKGSYEKALKIYEELYNSIEYNGATRRNYLNGLSSILSILIKLCREEELLSEAKEWSLEQIGFQNDWANATKENRDWSQVAYSIDVSGDIYFEEGDYQGAQNQYQIAYDLCKRINGHLSKRNVDDIFIGGQNSGLAKTISKKMDIISTIIKLSPKDNILLNSKQQDQKPGSQGDNRTNLSKDLLRYIYERMGDILQSGTNKDDAERWYRKALAISINIADDKNTLGDKKILQDIYMKLANVISVNKYTEAKALYLKALSLEEERVQVLNTNEELLSQINIYDSIGDICGREGNPSDATEWFSKSIDILEKLRDETDAVEIQKQLSYSYEKLSDFVKRQSDYVEAYSWIQKALIINQKLAYETEEEDYYLGVVSDYEKLGDIEKDIDNNLEAEEWYGKALVLCEQLVGNTKSVRAKRSLEHIYMLLGKLFDDSGNASEAKKWYKKYNDLNEELANETGAIPLPIGKNWLNKYSN